jgi:hypothetical protein
MMTYQALGSRIRFLAPTLAAFAALTSPGSLHAQSCALCYQVAANSGANFIQALKHGILVLLFPPLLIGTAIIIMAYRKRDQFAEDHGPVSD